MAQTKTADGFATELEEHREDGWTVARGSEEDGYALVKKTHWGSRFWHLIYLVFTIGILTIPYALYSRFMNPKTKWIGDPPGRIRRNLTKKNVFKAAIKIPLRLLGGD